NAQAKNAQAKSEALNMCGREHGIGMISSQHVRFYLVAACGRSYFIVNVLRDPICEPFMRSALAHHVAHA
ncbi:MAG: hypothetical protein WBW35_08815, partial [Xanthobacteraceae bacterium]